MNTAILHTNIQEYITKNLKCNVSNLALKGNPFTTVSTPEIIAQIEAKKRCEKKLPTWFQTKNIYYPNKLNIEQTSSENTAKYKAKLIKGNSLIDLTGGFGVDSYYFSKVFNSVIHCEINEDLSRIVAHNYKQLKTNIKTVATNGISYLKTVNESFDWIYLDPSRRHDSKGKVFFLKDCEPNVPEHQEFLLSKTNNILIKTAPLLDISVGLNELKDVQSIHVLAINNEVKELLWIIEKHNTKNTKIITCNIKQNEQQVFEFNLFDEKNTITNYSLPLQYLYEPNAAILKSGAFNSIAKQFSLNKLHKHTHLYTSNELINFPGRVFKIENIVDYNKKSLKDLAFEKANITTRNFPESVQQLRKKFKIKDGGELYLFFCTNKVGNKIVVQTKKLA